MRFVLEHPNRIRRQRLSVKTENGCGTFEDSVAVPGMAGRIFKNAANSGKPCFPTGWRECFQSAIVPFSAWKALFRASLGKK
jgi:hypothetical protein